MSAVKERILGAVTVMNENDAQTLWNIIAQKFGINWEDIEEVRPDEWDMQMLHEIKTNPECCEFVSEENAMKELGLA
ncbi:MAG: hypothetical protein NC231_12545 [Bacillus sp. (in: Bacteria)]|nr:hypothetical protein [Bacillus sp. (in: firmicutes)]MCM1427920.1 hypothetical protein [Eubacterium sp.]